MHDAGGQKKEQAYYIAPLQPPTLAPVKAWGSSEGAGRIGLALCLNRNRLQRYCFFFIYASFLQKKC